MIVIQRMVVAFVAAWVMLAFSPAAAWASTAPASNANAPAWGNLWAFPVALVALLVLAVVFFVVWRTGGSSPNQPLKYLESTWSFKDSWVSNVTVAGGLLTGIFGNTDVVTALLGKDAKNSLALATVGAATAAAFIAAGPMVVQATKSRVGDFFTVGGLLAASAVTLSGASGEIWVVYRSGQNLDLGGWEDRIWIAALLAGALLAVYAYRTLLATLAHGLDTPPPTPASDMIIAARMIVEALAVHPNIDRDRVEVAMASVAAAYPTIDAPPGDGSPRTRRSAVL